MKFCCSCCSVTKSCMILCDPMNCRLPGSPVLYYLLAFAQIHVHWGDDAFCLSLFSAYPFFFCLQSFPESVFSNESVLWIRWPKYWNFSFNTSPSNEYSGLISFRMDWLDLLAVQGTLKSFLQHHSSKTSVFRCSAFFIVQLSHPYMTSGKTKALTRWTFWQSNVSAF